MKSARPVVLVLGMPASGKTTCAKELAQCLHIPHRSMGDVLRAGRATRILTTSNDPATTYLELDLLRTWEEFSDGLVLDFSPINVEGDEQLIKMLHKHGFAICWIVYVKSKAIQCEMRYIRRGQRPGDPMADMQSLFRRRLTKEFQVFTLPMVHRAYQQEKLLVLDNRSNEVTRKNEVERVAGVIVA